LLQQLFPGGHVALFGSGTQSLSVALSSAVAGRAPDEREVIIPAYGCPDLVSACVLAGVKPRLVDIAATGWGYDPESLDRALTAQVGAVVAVNLLGVGDGRDVLHGVLRNRDIRIVHDSAQSLPQQPEAWSGDIVLSFGRGKPLNLLYGGALVSFSRREPTAAAGAARGLLDSRASALAFNMLTHPCVYHWASRVPMFKVGETRYKAPAGIEVLPETFLPRLGAALREHAAHDAPNPWLQVISEWAAAGVVSLSDSAALAGRRLLRMPMLARDREHRDRLVALMNAHGLGASPMYGVSLPRVAGLPQSAAEQGPFPNAERLAGRFFTLPTHAYVTAQHVAAADACVRSLR
jgi:dTDP-4-amino-4,6-dideoxygalactose transaminase